MLGKNVMLFCVNYIYTGVLVGLNDSVVKLEKPRIVYETGAFDTDTFLDAQAIPSDLYVTLSSIESFSVTNKK